MRGIVLGAVAACLMVFAQDTKYPPQGPQFPGPPTKADTADWLHELRQYRQERRIRAGLTGETYDRPELKWAQSSFFQPQAMVEDRYFYDPWNGATRSRSFWPISISAMAASTVSCCGRSIPISASI